MIENITAIKIITPGFSYKKVKKKHWREKFQDEMLVKKADDYNIKVNGNINLEHDETKRLEERHEEIIKIDQW